MLQWFNTLSPRIKLGITAICFLLVTLPRFNGNQSLVKNVPYDAKFFKAYVEYFRGEEPTAPIRPASNWRMLVPIIASLLPFAPLTSVNLVNLFCLALSLYFLFSSMRFLGIDANRAYLGLLLFIISFPTFYYSAIGYVDPGVMLFISMGVFATLIPSPALFLLCVFMGTLAKESILLILPFYFIYHFHTKRGKLISSIAFLIYLLESWLIRKYAPITPGERNWQFWTFSWDSVALNLHRWNSWLALPLSFGVVGLIFLNSSIRQRSELLSNKLLLASWGGLALGLAMYVVSYCTTVADGRFIWQCYYFMIIPGMAYFKPGNKD